MSAPPDRLETRIDHRLGQMAVRGGQLTAEQLREALEEQAEGLRRGRKKPRRLGVILAEKGWLSDAQVFALLEQQEAWVLAQDVRRREDGLLGRILVDAGLAEAAQVEECLRLQAEAVADGADPSPRLGDLLVEKGYTRREDLEQALDLQAGVRFVCPACKREWKGEELRLDDLGTCPGCKGPLEAVPAPEPEPPPPPPPPPAPLEGVPESLGRYRLVGRLGRGAIGEVYEAVDVQLDRKVAVKLLRSEFHGPAREKEVERLEREARMAARLPKHPGVAEVYEVGVYEGRHYIAMELVQGSTFGTWRKATGRSLRDLVRVLRDVAVAVQHGHDHGVLHRDLKPGNILVDAQGRPSVVDFGLARPADAADPAVSGAVCGTAAYMSPEQAQGGRDLDARCDVYSLGAMLYEVIAGRTPYQGESKEDILKKLRSHAVAPPGGFARSRAFSTVDAALEKLCLKALAGDRNRRTSTARAFAEELTAWLASRERQGPSLAEKPGKPRRGRLLLGVGGGVAAVLLLLLALLPRSDPEAVDLRRARGLAEGGQAEAALGVYEQILQRSPEHAKARQGHDVMMRHLLAEAAKDVEEAVVGVESARSALAAAEAALRTASLANEAERRDAKVAAGKRLQDAEARQVQAREALKRWSGERK